MYPYARDNRTYHHRDEREREKQPVICLLAGRHEARIEYDAWGQTQTDGADLPCRVDTSKRRKVVEQLERHNEGVAHLMIDKALSGKPRKLLMVQKEGYEAINKSTRRDFEDDIQELGWTIEPMPIRDIPDFSDLLDALR